MIGQKEPHMTVKDSLHLSFTWEQEKFQTEFYDGKISVCGSLSKAEISNASLLTEKLVEKLNICHVSSEKTIREVLDAIGKTWASGFGFSEETVNELVKSLGEKFVLIEQQGFISRRRMSGFGWIGMLDAKVRLANLNPNQFVVLGDKKYLPLFIRRGAVSAASQLALDPSSPLYQGVSQTEMNRHIVGVLETLKPIITKIGRGAQQAVQRFSAESPVQHPLMTLFMQIKDLYEKEEWLYTKMQEDQRFAAYLAAWVCSETIFTKLVRTDAALASSGKDWKDLEAEIEAGRLGRTMGVVEDGKLKEGAKTGRMLLDEFREAISSETTPLAQLTKALTFKPAKVVLPKVKRPRRR